MNTSMNTEPVEALLDEDSKALFFSFRAVGEPFRSLCLDLDTCHCNRKKKRRLP